MYRNSLDPSGEIIHFGERLKNFYIICSFRETQQNFWSAVQLSVQGDPHFHHGLSHEHSIILDKHCTTLQRDPCYKWCIQNFVQGGEGQIPIICLYDIVLVPSVWMRPHFLYIHECIFLIVTMVNVWECGHLDKMLKQRLLHEGQLNHHRLTMELVSMGCEYDLTKLFLRIKLCSSSEACVLVVVLTDWQLLFV